MPSRLFRRDTGRSLVVEINPYQILVLGINRPRSGPVVIEYAGEFDRAGQAGLRQWLDSRKEFRKRWLAVTGGYVSAGGIVQRETLKAADLANAEELIQTIREHQTRHTAASSAPFKGIDPARWTFRAVNADTGRMLPDDNVTRPALLVGLANQEIHEVQQTLLDCRLMPRRIEPALLPLFGSLYQVMERRRYTRAVVVFVLCAETTTVYILGKEGVHTPGPVGQGLGAIVKQVRKEFALETDEAALARLMNPDDELRRRARKILRGLGHELRPLIDSYEMTTGQPVGDVFCPYLPPALAWLVDPLVRSVDHESLLIDCHEWMASAGLQPAPDVPPFEARWLGVLSLVANLPGTTEAEIAGRVVVLSDGERPWHVDCRQTIEPPGSRWIGRRFLPALAAAAAMIFTVSGMLWQAYATRSLQADTAYWEEQMNANGPLVNELTSTLERLQAHTTRIGHAHDRMRQPYQLTDFLMELGRTLPPRMRIDRVEANDHRVLLTGSLLEPAEEASLSLGRYRETLRRDPEIGGLFSSITATSLQRERNSDSLMFEITLRLAPPAP